MIGIVCALDKEVEYLQSVMENKEEKTIASLKYISGVINGKDIVTTECGMGKVNAAMSTQIMIDYYHVDVIINSGIAGSLSEDIKIADIVISDDCVQHDMNTKDLGDPIGEITFNNEKKSFFKAEDDLINKLKESCKDLENTSVFIGRIASGDVFISSHKKRITLKERFNALACEMEGAAIAHVAYRNNVPFAILRCISDDFNQNEGMDYFKFRDIAAEKACKIISKFISLY